jgi:hypothetical protein
MQGLQVQENMHYYIKCSIDEKIVLDVPSNKKMYIWNKHGGAQQQFFFRPRAEGTYVI